MGASPGWVGTARAEEHLLQIVESAGMLVFPSLRLLLANAGRPSMTKES
jgi:hypothetical protein